MKFKVGDRVYFDSTTPTSRSISRNKGFGRIYRIDFDGDYFITKDESDVSYLIEPDKGETMVSEEIYNSPLYKAMSEK